MSVTVNVNETDPAPTTTPANLQVRAYQTDTDKGRTFGPFITVEAAQQCCVVLASRADIIRATIEAAGTLPL